MRLKAKSSVGMFDELPKELQNRVVFAVKTMVHSVTHRLDCEVEEGDGGGAWELGGGGWQRVEVPLEEVGFFEERGDAGEGVLGEAALTDVEGAQQGVGV